MLSGTLQDDINEALSESDWHVPVQLDRSRFFELYDYNLLSLAELTPHQKEKLQNISRFADVHLSAPAGAGKTFVAVQRVLDVLDSAPAARVLYVAPTVELTYHFLQWILVRHSFQAEDGVLSLSSMQELLSRVVVLHKPYTEFLSASLEHGNISFKPLTRVKPFKFAVIDESHNIFRVDRGQGELPQMACGYKLLLSDESQSSAVTANFPSMHRVKLTQVVRSTKRIVAGAAAFQLGTESTTSVSTDGPPLKSFLFDGPLVFSDLLEAYSQHVAYAFLHLANTFSGVSFHKRVALLVPDEDFLARLQPLVQIVLDNKFPHRRFRFVRFVDSLRSLPEHLLKFGAPTTGSSESVIMDTVDVADGLEHLIVICVGLDEEITQSTNDLAVRARFYKGITRAQLLAIVVNEHVKNGWLEFLSNVQYSGNCELSDLEASPQPCKAAADICQQAKESHPGEQKARSDGFQPRAEAKVNNSSPESSRIELADEEAASLESLRQESPEVQPKTETITQISGLWDTTSNKILAPVSQPVFNPLAEQSGQDRFALLLFLTIGMGLKTQCR